MYTLYLSVANAYPSILLFSITEKKFNSKLELNAFLEGMLYFSEEYLNYGIDHPDEKIFYHDENRDMLVFKIYNGFLHTHNITHIPAHGKFNRKINNPTFIENIENKDNFVYCEEEVCYKLKENIE